MPLRLRRSRWLQAWCSLSLALLLIAVSLAPLINSQSIYNLSASAQALVNTPDPAVAKTIHYDSQHKAFTINAAGKTAGAKSSSSNVLVGQPSTGLYSATLPTNLASGISVTDNTSGVSFTLSPDFPAGSGRYIGQRVIYPLTDGSIQAVYTPKATQLAEDIVVNRPGQAVLAFPYKLKLPAGLQSFQSADGSVAIESSGKVLFSLTAPVLKQSNGRPGGAAVANSTKLVLKNHQLLLMASNLGRLSYPLSIDPSITINSATNFLTGNDEGGNAVTTNQESTGSMTGGAFNNLQASCPTGWTLDSATTYCTNTTSLPTATEFATSVVYNGYVYEIGGTSSSAALATVYYAPINSNGTIGVWTATTSLPNAAYLATSVAYNGYVYEIGGYTTFNTSTAANTVNYAAINSNGTLGYWTGTNVPTNTTDATSVVYNGYIYQIGGQQGGNDSIVDYATINSNGTLGAWTATTSLPANNIWATSVVYNGYVYEIGGYATTSIATVDYAPINSNGTVGAWTATTSLSTAIDSGTSVVYNGYLYEIGGMSGTVYSAAVDYAPINANGSLGSWTAATSLPAATERATSVVYNGYVYEIGGYNGTNVFSTVDYAQIAPAGWVASPDSTDINTWGSTASVPLVTSKGKSYAPATTTSVAYNGYVYDIGGHFSNGVNTATVDYAPINANGSLGTWTATTSLPTGTEQATSVVYNGYVYEIGGYTTVTTATVDYAPINADGTLGTWTATTSLPTGTEEATSVVYNGYVYEIGGFSSTNVFSTVDYAPINSDGTLGAWAATTSLPAATEYASSVLYNGYVYEIGGAISGGSTVATIDYAPINSNGTLGPWTATTSLPNATYQATSVVYNGYVNEIGGSKVDYAPINSNGTLGAWTATTSLPAYTAEATSVVYNGYVYEIGGLNVSATSVATVDYAPINTNGSLGSWTATTSLPTATQNATSVVYNGYVYEIGGGNNGSTVYATVDYAALNVIPHIGDYSTLVTPADYPSQLWTSTTSIPAAKTYLSAVTYNGYAYEIGGTNGSSNLNTVNYAPINADGTLGAWTATTSLPTALDEATAVVSNGYIYFIGGYAAGTLYATVSYAKIGTTGALTTQTCPATGWSIDANNTWCTSNSSTTNLPAPTDLASSVVYNGYVYEIGGDNPSPSTTVDYAPINADGSLGTWTATTGLPATTDLATAVVSNGYIYEIGGNRVGAASATVSYAKIGTSGALTTQSCVNGNWTIDANSTWCSSNSNATNLPGPTAYATSVISGGYVYEIGGYNGSSGVATVAYSPVNSDGSLGLWTTTTSLPTTNDTAASIAYNGYVYEIGGWSGVESAAVYEDSTYNLLNNQYHTDITPVAITLHGTDAGNSGLGSSGPGGITITYSTASTVCTTFNSPSLVNVMPIKLFSTPYQLKVSSDGCGTTTARAQKVWVHFHLDDSQTASFPDIYGNHTTLTGFRIFYHPATVRRLRLGQTFNNQTLNSLDAPPTATQ